MGLGHDIFRAMLTSAFSEVGRVVANKIADRSKPTDPPSPPALTKAKRTRPARKQPKRRIRR
jgi:hypothetical protein